MTTLVTYLRLMDYGDWMEIDEKMMKMMLIDKWLVNWVVNEIYTNEYYYYLYEYDYW